MSKLILFGKNGREKMIKGVNIISDCVKSTLGPRGRTVMIGKGYGSGLITKDGITVAENITLEDPFENEGAKYVREVASKTNDIAGDGTTTATVLAQGMLKMGYENLYLNKVQGRSMNINPITMKKGIDRAIGLVIDNLEKISKKIETSEEIASVGTISANNDTEIGRILAEAMNRVGKNGVITIEDGTGMDTQVEIVEGMQFDRGYISPYFSTKEDLNCVLEDVYILLYNRPIQTLKEIIPILEETAREKKPLLIIADGVVGDAISGLVFNKMKGVISVCAVSCPSFGEERNNMMEDIAILTGGKYINDESGMKLSNVMLTDLGQAKKIIVSKDKTMIIDGNGEKDLIKERIKKIEFLIEKSEHPIEKEQIQKRLAKLTGGVAIIKVGGTTETEMKEKKDRAIDALNSTRSAVEEGVVAGGGVALLNSIKTLENLTVEDVSEQTGIDIVKDCLALPITQILINIGYEETQIDGILNKIKESNNINIGFDAKNEIIVDMIQAGIIDPTKVTKNALKNAGSIVGTLLTTEVFIVEKPIEGADMVMPKARPFGG